MGLLDGIKKIFGSTPPPAPTKPVAPPTPSGLSEDAAKAVDEAFRLALGNSEKQKKVSESGKLEITDQEIGILKGFITNQLNEAKAKLSTDPGSYVDFAGRFWYEIQRYKEPRPRPGSDRAWDNSPRYGHIAAGLKEIALREKESPVAHEFVEWFKKSKDEALQARQDEKWNEGRAKIDAQWEALKNSVDLGNVPASPTSPKPVPPKAK